MNNTCSKIWPNPKLSHFVDHHDDVMTENLAQGFVNHRRVAPASQGVPELPLNHREGRLDVRAPMVVSHKLFLPCGELVKHLVPCARGLILGLAVGLEGDKGSGPRLPDGVDVLAAKISLVSRNFFHREILRGRVQQGRKIWGVMLLAVRDPGGGDDVGLGSAHQMGLEPFTAGAFLSPLVLNPPIKSGRAETGGIDSKTPLNRRQRNARFRDEFLEDRCHSGLLEGVEDAVIVGELPDATPGMGFSQVTHESAPGNRAVDLEGSRKKGVRYRDRLAACFVPGGLRNSVNQVSEQDLKLVLLVNLGVVVGRPVLHIGPLDCLGYADTLLNGLGAVFIEKFLDRELDGHDVLAGDPASVEVRASATRSPVEANGVGAVGALRGNYPLAFLLLNSETGCYFNCFDFSGGHGIFSLRCKGHGPNNTGNSLHECLWHLAGLGPVERLPRSAGLVRNYLAAGVGFEPTGRVSARPPDLESGDLSRSSTPPLSSLFGFLLFQHLVQITGPHQFPLIAHSSPLSFDDPNLIVFDSLQDRVYGHQWIAPVLVECESMILKFLSNRDGTKNFIRRPAEHCFDRIGQARAFLLKPVNDCINGHSNLTSIFLNRVSGKLQETNRSKNFQGDLIPSLPQLSNFLNILNKSCNVSIFHKDNNKTND